MSQKNTVVSLFSGCGGLDLGFKMAGFNVIWATDHDKSACDTYKNNLDNSNICKDIKKISLTEIPYAKIYILGPPCQGFSNIGKRDLKDSRNYLINNALKIIIEKKPEIVVIENVKGLKSFNKGKILKKIVLNLKRLQYNVEWAVINAKNFGIPQSRERIFIVASKQKSTSFFENLKKYQKNKQISLREAIDDLDRIKNVKNHNIKCNLKKNQIKILSRISSGKKLCNSRLGVNSVPTWKIPEVFGKTSKLEKTLLFAIAKNRRKKCYRKKQSWSDASPLNIKEISEVTKIKNVKPVLKVLIKKGFIKSKGENLYDITHTFNGKYRRLHFDKISEAILTNYGNIRNYVHPSYNRPLSVRECARIQTFPDNFIFSGNIHSQYRQIGNAVPPKLAAIIAKCIDDTFINKDKKFLHRRCN